MNAFEPLGLTPLLQRAAAERGYTAPTPVQAAALPAVLAGRDVQACAPTGSGKTAAYALPLLQQLDALPRHAPRRTHTLVLVPTRELAQQVSQTLHALARHLSHPLRVVTLQGGVSINPQLMALRGGAEVVVATPGRLLDVVAHNALKLNDVAHLVLDEADRLLEAGFADELQRVLALLPARRQTLLFSATFAPAVQALADALLHEPQRIEAPPSAPPAHTVSGATGATPDAAPPGTLHERAIEVDTARRTPLLRHLLQQDGWRRVLVFVATRYACDHVADKLRQHGIAAAAFHGEASQGARNQALADFKAGHLRVLVATDLAARGLHIDQLPVVVNFDLPRAAADYTHRIGRTARAGASGLAVSFVTPATEAHFRLIEKRQARRVPRERLPGFEPTEAAPSRSGADGTGGIKGKRLSKKDKLRAAGLR